MQVASAAWRARARFLSLRASCSWSCVCRATQGLPPQRHWCTVGVLAGTHQCALRCPGWHREQSANPLWLLVLLRGRSRGRGVLCSLRVHVCLGILTDPVKPWENKVQCFFFFFEIRHLKRLDRIDGEQMEFEWAFIPGFTTLQILAEIQNMMTESKCEPEQSKRKIIFMSMYSDIDRVKRVRMLSELPSMLEDSRDDIGRFQGHARIRNGTQLVSTNLMKNGRKLLQA